MLQLVYVSTAYPAGVRPDIDAILNVSRRNNRRDGITGLLYVDDRRFLQALEGPEPMVEAAYRRICRDARHRAPVVLSRRTVDAREFGSWEMAHRTAGADVDAFLFQISTLLADAAPRVRATFEGFAKVRSAAA